MRECIYCGKQLEKGEQCTCAMSVAKRMERAQREQAQAGSGHTQQNKKEEKQREKEREKAKKQREKEAKARERKQKFSRMHSSVNKNVFANVWQLFRDFMRSPIDTVMNPGIMNKAEILIFVIIEGIISGLCVFSVVTGASRGPFRLLGNLFGFKGAAGYNVLMGWFSSAIAGAVGGLLIFFLFTGIFYFINKMIFKQFTAYWDFSRRFAFVSIPSTIIGAVGVILGIFSQTTFVILLLCGLIGTVALIYEILRSMWHSKSATKTIYTMMAGFFVFLLVVLYIVRLALL